MTIHIKPAIVFAGFFALSMGVQATQSLTSSRNMSVHLTQDLAVDYDSAAIKVNGATTRLQFQHRIDATFVTIDISKFNHLASYKNGSALASIESTGSRYGGHFELTDGEWHTNIGAELTTVPDLNDSFFDHSISIDWAIIPWVTIGLFSNTVTIPFSLGYRDDINDLHYRFSPRISRVGAKCFGTEFGTYDVAVSALRTDTNHSNGQYLDLNGNGVEYQGRVRAPETTFGTVEFTGIYSVLNDLQGGIYDMDGQVGQFGISEFSNRTLGLAYIGSGFRTGIQDTQIDTRSLYAKSTAHSSDSWGSLAGQKLYRSDQILYSIQRIFIETAPQDSDGWQGHFSVGRLALTGNIDDYTLPLFFWTYSGTTALDIAEIDFIDLKMSRKFQLSSQSSFSITAEQLIPFRIIKTSAATSSDTNPGSGPPSSSTESQDIPSQSGWGGFKLGLALTAGF